MIALSPKKVFLVIVLLLGAFSLQESKGLPSGDSYPPTFTFKNGYWYDSWGFNRNYYGNVDGYMPNVAYETIGNNRELAYKLGENFKATYASRVQRAVAILKYVQKWTEYGYDVDNVVMGGVPQREWAWNADEMAHMFNATTNTIAVGDCEDMSFLCATIYIGAGFDVALVLAPYHVATLIWLPEYPNANYYWDIPNDGRDQGWIWVEATGEQNPLGWTPPDFADGDWTAYFLGSLIFNVGYNPKNPQAEDNVTVTASVINAKASVSQVTLYYSIQEGTRNRLNMTNKDSTYETVVPKQPKGTTVEFYISATDSEGNTRESEKFAYTVGKRLEFPWIIIDFLLEDPWILVVLIGLVALLILLTKR